MELDEAVRGARLLASDIENSLGFSVEVSTEYTEEWRTFGEQTGRPLPKAWVSLAVAEAGTTAALDPSEPGSESAEGFATELALILQDDLQIHTRNPWPRDPAAGGRSLEPTARGWKSSTDTSYLVPYGQIGRSPRQG